MDNIEHYYESNPNIHLLLIPHLIKEKYKYIIENYCNESLRKNYISIDDNRFKKKNKLLSMKLLIIAD